MRTEKKTRVIYGDAPLIDDMGMLTTLSLLNDEVLLFGSETLSDELAMSREKNSEGLLPGEKSIQERMMEMLIPEGVIAFYAPNDVNAEFPGAGHIELPGITGIEQVDVDGKAVFMFTTDNSKLNPFSRLVLQGIGQKIRTVNSVLRELRLLSAAAEAALPIVCESIHIGLSPTSSKVSEVASFLAHRTLQRLALPELHAYYPEDILEARLKLKNELQEFRSGILELVWLLHQTSDIRGNLEGLGRQCDILIETKIVSAVSQLERAIISHESKKIRRILKTTGGALLDLGRSLLTPSLAGALLGGSGALLKISEALEVRPPTLQIASFVYKVRDKKF
jgi:hypothetical protein